jgi:hypothetical protein
MKQYNVQFEELDIKLLRWSIKVAMDALSLQEEFPADDIVPLISGLNDLDESIFEQVSSQKDTAPTDQLRLFQ